MRYQELFETTDPPRERIRLKDGRSIIPAAIIVIDVQPEYAQEINRSFDLVSLMHKLSSFNKVLFLYNQDDNPLEVCKKYWLENGLNPSVLENADIIAKDVSANYRNLLALLKQYDNAQIVGGSDGLCIKDVTNIMDSFGISYKLNREFIYE